MFELILSFLFWMFTPPLLLGLGSLVIFERLLLSSLWFLETEELKVVTEAKVCSIFKLSLEILSSWIKSRPFSDKGTKIHFPFDIISSLGSSSEIYSSSSILFLLLFSVFLVNPCSMYWLISFTYFSKSLPIFL